jgi:hypothetical protein
MFRSMHSSSGSVVGSACAEPCHSGGGVEEEEDEEDEPELFELGGFFCREDEST